MKVMDVILAVLALIGSIAALAFWYTYQASLTQGQTFICVFGLLAAYAIQMMIRNAKLEVVVQTLFGIVCLTAWWLISTRVPGSLALVLMFACVSFYKAIDLIGPPDVRWSIIVRIGFLTLWGCLVYFEPAQTDRLVHGLWGTVVMISFISAIVVYCNPEARVKAEAELLAERS